jgi:hypothetical protein
MRMRVAKPGWAVIGLLISLAAWGEAAVDAQALTRLPDTFSNAWVVIAAQKINAGPARPEAQDISSPISVPGIP